MSVVPTFLDPFGRHFGTVSGHRHALMESTFRNQFQKSPQATKAPKEAPKPLQKGHPNRLKKSSFSTLTDVGLTQYLLYLEHIGRSRVEPKRDPNQNSFGKQSWNQQLPTSDGFRAPIETPWGHLWGWDLLRLS